MESYEKIEAVQRMQDYIEENISNSITLYMLAQAAGYSPWYSARIFKDLLGKTPFEYIRSLRLSLAAVRMRDEDVKIVDVAFDFVFDSHEGFTRAFSKEFGITPRYYCKNTPPIKLFIPSSIRDYYNMLQKGDNKMKEKSNVNTVFVQVIDKPARKVILKRAEKAAEYFAYCEELGCDVWGVLCSIKEALNEPIGMWMPENLRPTGTSIYTQGVEVPMDYKGEVPEGFEIIELKPCKMMVFQGQPYDDEKFGEAIDEVWTVIKNYNPEIYGFKWAEEEGPRFQFAPMGYRGYIEGRPVKLINS
ncbi:helix-turn-helix transcriptional regulator [Clostridium cellulovorans]|uniref:Transcriptional regulator, AraC family n=1 Tax=Clostridium cellulovorans (strain ATCC 35296 / DSM 3052 / OCM 3 / 743B) TaxID=573061 RepID=D9SQN0_CLOC7|nr:AraC family transcriptional regulator [Clostridium cellulovorans]ADL52236.1 transcriptional regulator, AraC family [Clostridium cellulovorans 743B]